MGNSIETDEYYEENNFIKCFECLIYVNPRATSIYEIRNNRYICMQCKRNKKYILCCGCKLYINTNYYIYSLNNKIDENIMILCEYCDKKEVIKRKIIIVDHKKEL